jgi:hypothetical protein
MFAKLFWSANSVIAGTLLGWFGLYWVDLIRGVEPFGLNHALTFLFLSHLVASMLGYRKYVTGFTQDNDSD